MRKLILGCIFLLFCGSFVYASGDLDQSITWGSGENLIFLGSSSTYRYFAQTFTATQSGNLNQIDLEMRRIGTKSGNVWVCIYSNLSNHPDSSLGCSDQYVRDTFLSTSYEWKTFNFSSNVAITASIKYYIVVTTDQANDGTNYILPRGSCCNTYYAVSETYRYSGNGTSWNNHAENYMYFKQYINLAPSPTPTPTNTPTPTLYISPTPTETPPPGAGLSTNDITFFEGFFKIQYAFLIILVFVIGVFSYYLVNK